MYRRPTSSSRKTPLVTYTPLFRSRFAVKEQRGGVAPAAEHAVEDPPLARVGVLELVHQRHRVLRAQLARERVAVRAVESVGDTVDQDRKSTRLNSSH